MVKHDLKLHVKAPLEKVFAYVTDFRNAAEWQNGIIESSQTPEGPTQLGSKFKTVRTLFGQRMEAAGEVTDFVPNKKFAFKSTSGPIHFAFVQTFEPETDGTLVNLALELEAGGFFKLAEGALAGNVKQEFESQTKKLKSILET
jgi:uncharacterized membrane protein